MHKNGLGTQLTVLGNRRRRAADGVATRLSGDEFAVLVKDVSTTADVEMIKLDARLMETAPEQILLWRCRPDREKSAPTV